jgi:hypothetical protein
MLNLKSEMMKQIITNSDYIVTYTPFVTISFKCQVGTEAHIAVECQIDNIKGVDYPIKQQKSDEEVLGGSLEGLFGHH